jgi:phosphatidylethanolamine N-methyltransferase
MYSVGYAGYYGLSIGMASFHLERLYGLRFETYHLSTVTGSYTVFFASLVAHAAQFAFLLWFENPRKSYLSLEEVGWTNQA